MQPAWHYPPSSNVYCLCRSTALQKTLLKRKHKTIRLGRNVRGFATYHFSWQSWQNAYLNQLHPDNTAEITSYYHLCISLYAGSKCFWCWTQMGISTVYTILNASISVLSTSLSIFVHLIMSACTTSGTCRLHKVLFGRSSQGGRDWRRM
jgi:hypothetical protein